MGGEGECVCVCVQAIIHRPCVSFIRGGYEFITLGTICLGLQVPVSRQVFGMRGRPL